MVLANLAGGANRHPGASREGEMHDATQLRCATSHPHLLQFHNSMPYKPYGIHSNEVLDKYFSYNPHDFMWMCWLTDTPACELAVAEIEQQLETEGDLNFQGLLSDRIVYANGHWIPLEDTNGISYEGQGLVDLVRNATQLHSRLEDEWLSSTTAVDDGTKWCRNRLAVENRFSGLKTLTLCPSHPLEIYGERMFVPHTLKRLAVERVVSSFVGDEADMLLVGVQTASPMGRGRGGEGLAEDRTDVDTFIERSRCSDAKSSCSKDSFESLASQQGPDSEDEASNEIVAVAEEKEDDRGCHPQQIGKLISRQVKLDDVVDIIRVSCVKKPPDKGPSREGPGRGGASAPHNDGIESSSASAMCTLQNDDTCHFESLKQTAGLRDRHRVLEPTKALQDRAASPVGRGRGGKHRREEIE
jgi:hypothetical protein